ncbi:hypothetical protein [Streptomyces sp. NPDC003730]
MSLVDGSEPAAYAAAVQDVARRLHRTLYEGRHREPVLAQSVRQAGRNRVSVLAAVRVLGPDALAPALLVGTSPHPEDRDVVAETLLTFPPAREDPVEATCLAHAQQTLAEEPVRPACEEAHAAQRSFVTESERDTDWCAWAERMARLSPLAWPTLAGQVADRARERVADVERGLTRSMLRRDYASAARLARWAALTQALGTRSGLELEPLLRHLGELGGGTARVLLDVGIARRLSAARRGEQ